MDLEGKLLVAMPGMGDTRFEHSVVLICSYSDKGAMGLIINKPSRDVRMSDVLDQLEIEPTQDAQEMQVHFGGPVETGRGFVLHSGEYSSSLHTLKISDSFGMTATLDVLEDLANGDGPAHAVMALGYSGWAPGQLEAELGQNGWLTCDADAGIVFGTDMDGKWEAALAKLGVSPLMLSAESGRA